MIVWCCKCQKRVFAYRAYEDYIQREWIFDARCHDERDSTKISAARRAEGPIVRIEMFQQDLTGDAAPAKIGGVDGLGE